MCSCASRNLTARNRRREVEPFAVRSDREEGVGRIETEMDSARLFQPQRLGHHVLRGRMDVAMAALARRLRAAAASLRSRREAVEPREPGGGRTREVGSTSETSLRITERSPELHRQPIVRRRPGRRPGSGHRDISGLLAAPPATCPAVSRLQSPRGPASSHVGAGRKRNRR